MRGRTLLAAAGGGLIFALAPAALALAPRPGSAVAIIARDGWSAIPQVVQAGGSVLSLRGQYFVFAYSPDPDFLPRLRAAGLWLVVDADGVGGCKTDFSGNPMP